MKPTNHYLIFALLSIGLVFFAAEFLVAPESFRAMNMHETIAHATLLTEGKNRLQLTSETFNTKLSCIETPEVCSYVRDHQNGQLSVIVVKAELLPVDWLISARSGDVVLQPIEKSEIRLTRHKLSFLWAFFLVGIPWVGYVMKGWKLLRMRPNPSINTDARR